MSGAPESSSVTLPLTARTVFARPIGSMTVTVSPAASKTAYRRRFPVSTPASVPANTVDRSVRKNPSVRS